MEKRWIQNNVIRKSATLLRFLFCLFLSEIRCFIFRKYALKPRLTSVCWAIYVMVTFYIDVQDRKLQELQKLENQTETTGEYIPEYDYYESTDFQLPLRFLQENFQNSRIDILRSQW